jgi:CheY-like chemotaxis protein
MALPLLLVVEDAPDLVFIVRRLGKYAGYEVEARGDVPAAWQYLEAAQFAESSAESALRARPPHLVLVDVNLPGTPGSALCHRLRAEPRLADLPVALFTHWDRGEDMAAGLAAGADFVLCKDLLGQTETWSERIREILDWPHGRRTRRLLDCPQIIRLPAPPAEMLQAFNPALRQVLLRRTGPRVLSVLAQQALQTVAWWRSAPTTREMPPRPRPQTLAPDAWPQTSGLGLDPEDLVQVVPPEAVVVFLVALVEQIEGIVGIAPARPLWAALAWTVPELAEILVH